MNGHMKKYKESLTHMPEPILLSQCPDIKLDLRGLMQYSQKKGIKVIDLTDEEKVVFIKNKYLHILLFMILLYIFVI